MLLCYFGAISGFPMPRWASADIAGQPFPCQHHRCGCTSAGQCWTGCCCFTHAQKLAWARKQGVQPPAYVAVVAARATTVKKKQAPKACCAGATCSAEETSTSDSPRAVRSLPCRGLGSNWTSLTMPIAPPPERMHWSQQFIPIGSLQAAEEFYAAAAAAPATPPG